LGMLGNGENLKNGPRSGVLSVDGKEVASKTIPHTVPALFTIDESFDVGVDTRTGVEDKDYKPPFRFSGKVGKLTVKLVPLKAAEEKCSSKRPKTRETRHSKSLRLMTPANFRYWPIADIAVVLSDVRFRG
jgi:hypothetical protein